MKAKMLLVVPFTGLGLYGGYRGDRWLRNRIKVFEQFVIPSLKAQTDQNFILWVAWRREEKTNPMVVGLLDRLQKSAGFPVVFTYSGIPIWDDKYPEAEGRERLGRSLSGSMGELVNYLTDCDQVFWLLQPSDDLYDRNTVASVKAVFKNNPKIEAVAFTKGYLINYLTKEVREYNPNTTPPFAAIRFKRSVFIDPAAHLKYVSMKIDAGPYKKGTPMPSHEYLGNCFKMATFEGRGFMVGTHGENISTHFNHPFGGQEVADVLWSFGIKDVPPLKLPHSFRKWFMRQLPHAWRRKLRYWFGELLAQKIYNWLRK